MITPLQALQALHREAAAPEPEPVLLLGAGGWLGAALLAQLLASGAPRVGAWVTRADHWRGSSHRGVVGLQRAQLAQPDPHWQGACAYLVLERGDLGGARNAVFAQPQPDELLTLAADLHRLGVRRLVVLLPHAAGLLPEALRHGFADATEQALSTLGFGQLLLVRSSRHGGAPPAGGWVQRIAALGWEQLRWMLPDDERPLRSVALARVVVVAARLLRGQPRHVVVLPQALASRAAHAPEGIEAHLRAALTMPP